MKVQFGEEVTSRLIRYLSDYEDWQRGGMPLAGGLEDQPAKWVQRVWIIDGEYAKRRRKDAEKRAKDRERERANVRTGR